MQITIKHVPIFPDNPQNPAKSNVATGVITINDSVWGKLTPIEQDYWLAHEEGHIRNVFGSEVDADTYAFRKIAGSQKYSLRDIRRSLRKIIATNPNAPEAKARLLNNAQLSLLFASNRGSELAKQILKEQSKIKSTQTMTTFINSSSLTFPTTKSTVVATPVKTAAATKSTVVATPVKTATATKSTVVVTPVVVPVFNNGIVESKTIVPVANGNTIYSGASLTAPIPEAAKNGTAPKENTGVNTGKEQETSEQPVRQMVKQQEQPAEQVVEQPIKQTTEQVAEQPKETTALSKFKNKKVLYAVVTVAVVLAVYFINKTKK